MNKQLQRDLQCSIQSLKQSQLMNVLSRFEQFSQSICLKNIAKKGISFECQIIFKQQHARGYGRTQQQSVNNATKNLLSMLIGKNAQAEKIMKALKYKNGMQGIESKTLQKKITKQAEKCKQIENSLFLDQISVIQPNDGFGQINQKGIQCDCLFYNSHEYFKNQIKHLQARVSLLNEQNMLLKKMLLCGNNRQPQIRQKQNNSHQSNLFNSTTKTKI